MSNDLILWKDVPFGGHIDVAPYCGGLMLPKPHIWGEIGIFKPNMQNIPYY